MNYWYNGKLVPSNSLEIELNDPGFLYGATVFTTLRVYEHSLDHPLTNWQAHCQRLQRSIETFSWQMPNWEGLREGAETLLTEFTVIRITIFADGRELILGRFLPENLAQKQQQGITAWVADTALFRRSLAAYKTGNYLSAWLALQQAQQLGAQEAILVDLEGNWLETSTGNLWGYGDGCWWTPPLDGQILPGIGRSQLLNWLQSQGLMVQESVWTAALIPNFEAIAYSNSVVEIIPIQQILVPENQLFLNFQHPALAQLHSYFHDR